MSKVKFRVIVSDVVALIAHHWTLDVVTWWPEICGVPRRFNLVAEQIKVEQYEAQKDHCKKRYSSL
jgi:hypothetical protein